MKTINEGVQVTRTFQRDFETLINQFMLHFTQIIEQSVGEAIKSSSKERTSTSQKASDLGADFITKEQALILLKISKPTLIRYQKEGLLPYYRVGRKVYFKMSELVEATRVTPNKREKNRREAKHD